MTDSWQTETGLTQSEFEKFTRYCNGSDNSVDNRNRAVALGFTEEGIKIAPGAIVRIAPPGRVGANTFIGLYCYINGIVTIGSNVLVGPHCSLAGGNHRFDPKTQSFSGREKDDLGLEIGDGSWLATGVTVTAGVRIGKANLICANSVVTKSTPDYAIVAGTPAKQIGRIDPVSGDYCWGAS